MDLIKQLYFKSTVLDYLYRLKTNNNFCSFVCVVRGTFQFKFVIARKQIKKYNDLGLELLLLNCNILLKVGGVICSCHYILSILTNVGINQGDH